MMKNQRLLEILSMTILQGFYSGLIYGYTCLYLAYGVIFSRYTSEIRNQAN